MPMQTLQNFYRKPRLCWYRLALPELRMLTEIFPPSYNVLFNIKTFWRASFGGSSYRINILFFHLFLNESCMSVDLY